MGVEQHEPRVVNMLLDFVYSYVSGVLSDAAAYAEQVRSRVSEQQLCVHTARLCSCKCLFEGCLCHSRDMLLMSADVCVSHIACAWGLPDVLLASAAL
jgi:hypothetical protein